MKRLVLAVLVGFALSAVAYARDPAERAPRLGPDLLGGIVQESDVDLVFDYLRDALRAAMDGRDAQPPDELVRRAEAIGDEMKRRGAAAAQAVLDAIERSVRDSMREPRGLPPTSPSQRL